MTKGDDSECLFKHLCALAAPVLLHRQQVQSWKVYAVHPVTAYSDACYVTS